MLSRRDHSAVQSGHGHLGVPQDTNPMSRWRRNRSSAHLAVPPPAPTSAPSKATPTLSKSASRMSLFSLFSKPKVEKARGHTEVGLAVPMQDPSPPTATPKSPPKSALRQNPTPAAQQVQRMRSSQMIRPISMRSSSPSKDADVDHWEPPPLFQAYPQAIKYATVQACSFTPDMLLRTQSQRKQAELLRERMDSHRDLTATLDNETKKLEKSHRRLNSVLTAAPQLSTKVYVLVTSGYLLQYAGDGPFDRAPEKFLKLGKDSAAFASDLIPGKHWVLQVLQSANEDGTASAGPKHSLLSRLRMHGPSTRRAAASFLLVMESAEEMESWMTTVRKEIENFGGMKTSGESSRESSSSAEESKKLAMEDAQKRRISHQATRMRNLTPMPVDSPVQSQYSGSPRIVASDWEGDRAEKTVSIADTTSVYSTRQSNDRRSMEASSIATTAISYDQLQLDQLRERSRFSYMSTATTASGTATKSTSRNSSPAPTSPAKERLSIAESEPLRSATSLRSFHMSPGNTTSRRRSMQPLPVTNEDGSLSAVTPPPAQRHSIYGPTSPTVRETTVAREPAPVIRPPRRDSKSKLEPGVLITPLDSFTPTPVPAAEPAPAPKPKRLTLSQLETQNLVRYSTRSSSAPPLRNLAVSPPPRDPAPTPPAARRQSTMGNSAAATSPPNHSERRISSTPKPFLRPFPVRPQTTDTSIVVPRRMSSLAPAGPAPLPLGVVINRSVTAPISQHSTVTRGSSPVSSSNSTQTAPSGQPLRRPTSVQIRSDPAPFLSSRRIVSSTPSFVPGNRASAAPAPIASLRESPSIPVLRGQGAQLVPPKVVAPRRSMPAMALPPPAPPPNMPLPAPPPTATRPVAV